MRMLKSARASGGPQWLPFLEILGVLGILFVPACSREPSEEARAHFEAILGALEGGKLGEAYARLIPATYDRELNDVLSMTQDLLDAEELRELRRILERTANEVASALAARAARATAEEARPLDAMAAKFRGLPLALGLDDLVRFRSLNLAATLRILEGICIELVTLAPVREQLAAVTVRVDESRGEQVRLGFATTLSHGGAEDKVDLVRKEGKWIPIAWMTDWPRVMAELRARIVTLSDRKSREPRIVKEELANLDMLLQEAGSQVDALLDRAGVGRG